MSGRRPATLGEKALIEREGLRKSMKTTVYDATGRDRLQLSAWRTMFRELCEYRELSLRLGQRSIVAQFRQSLLGLLWIILPPVATTVVFAVLRQASVVQVPMDGHVLPYTLFVLLGTTLWGFFTQVSVSCTASIANAGSLVSKVYFPREVLVLSALGSATINFLIRVLLLGLTFALYRQAPAWPAIFAPLLLFPMLAFGLGLALLLAPINTMMQDVSRLLEFVFQFGMFLAPTVYPTPRLEMATTSWQVLLFWLHRVNPVSCFMTAISDLVEYGTFTLNPSLTVATVVSFLTLAVGWRVFHICEPMLAERL